MRKTIVALIFSLLAATSVFAQSSARRPMTVDDVLNMIRIIEVGKFADFVVVGENIFTVDADRIRYIPILKTIVGGKEIYTAEEAAH